MFHVSSMMADHLARSSVRSAHVDKEQVVLKSFSKMVLEHKLGPKLSLLEGEKVHGAIHLM